MKVRYGFVSNSSSSSFVIGINNGDFSPSSLLEAFKVPEDSPMYEFTKEFAETMYNLADEITLEQFLSDFGYESLEEAFESRYGLSQATAEMFENGMRVYRGYASSEEYGMEGVLCHTTMEYSSDDISVFSEGR